MVARVLFQGEFYMTNSLDQAPFIDYWALPPANRPDDAYERVFSLDPIVGHFPYGRPVVPDGPV
jgi:hypothetical protein